MKSLSIKLFIAAICALSLAGVSIVWSDPPGRVGRLNFITGTVSFHPESTDQWDPATLNYPLTIGDNLWADQDGEAEVHVGSTAIRLASSTELSFLNLNDQTTQIRLSTGSLNVRVRQLGPAEQIEIDTPNASLSLLRAGSYRIDVQQTGDTAVTVRSGETEVTAGTSVFPVSLRQQAAITGLDSPTYQTTAAPPLDNWDLWCQARDQKEDHVASAQYIPRDLEGVEDLDQNGTWSVDPNLGPVWVPTVVVSGWAPYRFGHWAWVDPWGWTWIDDAPWGFAPFHYGRWAFLSNVWVWVPGAHVTRPVYAPALVTFVGGSGDSVGWFPLGPHEPYVAPYRSDRTRLHNIDVQHFNYANRNVPGVVTVVPNDAFVRGRPAGKAALVLPNTELGRAPVRGAALPLTPQKQSVIGGAPANRGRVAQPPAAIMSRPVVARLTPPPQAVPAARPPVTVVTPSRIVRQPVVRQPVVSPQAQANGRRPSVPMVRQPVAPPAGQVVSTAVPIQARGGAPVPAAVRAGKAPSAPRDDKLLKQPAK